MYAQREVERKIEIASERGGFRLEYHSPADIADFERRLEDHYRDEYEEARAQAQGAEDSSKTFQVNIQRLLCDPQAPKLSRDEIRFIEPAVWMYRGSKLSVPGLPARKPDDKN